MCHGKGGRTGVQLRHRPRIQHLRCPQTHQAGTVQREGARRCFRGKDVQGVFHREQDPRRPRDPSLHRGGDGAGQEGIRRPSGRGHVFQGGPEGRTGGVLPRHKRGPVLRHQQEVRDTGSGGNIPDEEGADEGVLRRGDGGTAAGNDLRPGRMRTCREGLDPYREPVIRR